MPWLAAVAAIVGTAVSASQGGKSKKAMERAERARRERIKLGTTSIDEAFKGYNPEFFKQREKAYTEYALPQEAAQFRDAQKKLTFGLSRKGLAGSSAAKTNWSNLFRTHAGAQQSIADSAVNQANELKLKVEQDKQGVIGQLYQSADPGRASAQAAMVAQGYQQPNAFAPLANMFSSLTNQWANQEIMKSFQKGAAFASPTGGEKQFSLASALGDKVWSLG